MPAAQPRSASRYRWIVAWLSVGCAIAFLLLGNAVLDYRFVARLLATQQVRHQMSQMSSQVEQEIRRDGVTPDTLQKALADTPRDAESINLRNSEGTVLQHVGEAFPANAFSLEEERRAFAQRQPLTRTISTPTGDVVIEAFGVRPFRRPQGPPGPPPSGPPPIDARPMILEIALPLKDADSAVLQSIRRNLFINLAAALSLLATALLTAFGLRAYVKGQRLEEQIEIARQVQVRLLPHASLELPGVQIAMEYKPSEQIGGDFYDAFVTDTNGIAVLIGDVSGKGIPAALLMGVIHGAVRSAAWQTSAASHEAESRKLNRLLCEHSSGNRFASMFWCVYDQPLHSLRYINAGHCPPFLISRRDGTLTTSRLDRGGPVLGLLPQAQYEATTVAIAPGDLLVMYSDGLVEATNTAGQEFGDERVLEILHRHFDQTPFQIRDALMSSLTAFASIAVPHDDLTFAVIRF
jgi:sigma-B regulation protein RsbU (phosphoserine phosphatase)